MFTNNDMCMARRFNFVADLPGLVIAKDDRSIYLSISQDFAKLLGWQSALNCPGKSDYDIPCKAAEFADEFIKMDKKAILSGEKMLALDIQQYTDGWKLVLVERNPIKNECGLSIGLFNQCIDISNTSFFRAYLLLHQLDNKLLGKNTKPVSYTLSDSHCPLPLTEKQENCIFLLIRGKTVKEIAKILGISPRTVESHLEAVKNKLNCQNKSEIIEKAIDSGFLYYVPKSLQEKSFEKIVAAIYK